MTDPHQQQRYRVIEKLASGGMAEVFLAESAGIEGFKKQVAIKRVLPALSEKKRFIAMFLDEARLSAHLSHSNVAQVFDIGVGDNAYFIVMEYVDGADLKAIIEWMKKSGRPIPTEAAVYIAAKICEGLTYAHELKGSDGQPLRVVHRDMSPPNVLLTKFGEVKIVDFGLAKATSQLEKSEAGIIKGKYSYLSPEAAEGLDLDHRADIFAVGIILWEMLTGKRLFAGESDFQTVKLVQKAEVPLASASNKGVPAEIDQIITRSLARERDKRYASAREFGKDLWDFLFRFGRSVSAFDIAELVRGAMSMRKRAPASAQASLIDKLIEETLLEFTSLQSEEEKSLVGVPEEPAKLPGFYDISTWADEVGGDQESARRNAQGEEAGNSEAVEGGGAQQGMPASAPMPLVARRVSERPPARSERPPARSERPPVKSEKPSTGHDDAAGETPEPELESAVAARRREGVQKKRTAAVPQAAAPLAAVAEGGSGTMKVLLLLATLAMLAAGAYFGGVIPH
ncbi:serine/threonine protein kinase [Chondromyces apiculatus]|uniref:Serine/threonine-protein kinase Pkn6 n=1 Tax=Chondromyces apiculatus DSM 436 TaxID=1192034 RepID=A0A017TFE3_9BACT|nr:serine/threonine-protein kinase [Chondromyces apiculatus]EYF07336.1 serine/threonine-protein kinase Pkn6 [Chondromyces apiculatus DSM 436]